jgi:hypothetical protein
MLATLRPEYEDNLRTQIAHRSVSLVARPSLLALRELILLQPHLAPANHLISIKDVFMIVADRGRMPNKTSPVTHEVESVHILGTGERPAARR